MNSGSTNDDTWRNITIAPGKKRISSAYTWGNGVKWEHAPARVGQWIRIYPHTLPEDDQVLG